MIVDDQHEGGIERVLARAVQDAAEGTPVAFHMPSSGHAWEAALGELDGIVFLSQTNPPARVAANNFPTDAAIDRVVRRSYLTRKSEGVPSQASAWIVNPLTGRQVRFANLFMTHPPTADRIAKLTGRVDTGVTV